MKSYGRFCSLSRALDLIGDRWTMLVVRELLVAPSRYTDLQKSLPGIATNLLANRLRTLEESGIVTSTEAPAPVATRVYSLTPWGRGLQKPLVELARWGAPLMSPGAGDDDSRGRWLVFAVMAPFPQPDESTKRTDFPTVSARIDADGDSLLLESDSVGVRTRVVHRDQRADVVVTGTSEQIFRILSGRRSRQANATVEGDTAALQRLDALVSLALTRSSSELSSASIDVT